MEDGSCCSSTSHFATAAVQKCAVASLLSHLAFCPDPWALPLRGALRSLRQDCLEKLLQLLFSPSCWEFQLQDVASFPSPCSLSPPLPPLNPVEDLLTAACSSIFPGAGTNQELALHCLHESRGDILVRHCPWWREGPSGRLAWTHLCCPTARPAGMLI